MLNYCKYTTLHVQLYVYATWVHVHVSGFYSIHIYNAIQDTKRVCKYTCVNDAAQSTNVHVHVQVYIKMFTKLYTRLV